MTGLDGAGHPVTRISPTCKEDEDMELLPPWEPAAQEMGEAPSTNLSDKARPGEPAQSRSQMPPSWEG